MANPQTDDKRPTRDPAEDNAFFPSPYSLSQFTAPKSNLSGADYPNPYRGGKKILMIGADERYLLTDNGTFFSTGNHPVETLLPMYHLDKAGFTFDVATVSGNPVKFEFWAMPSEDREIKGLFAKYRDRFKQPLKLSEVIGEGLDDYVAIFIPGGHGALIGLPESEDVKAVLEWAAAKDRFVVSLCHGPAAFLAVGDSGIYRGYKICAFPDALDAQTPGIGYMPGHLTWKFGEKLKALGFDILNEGISGAVHRDRKLLTGDSPLAGNALGKLAADTILKEVGVA
ncbi:MULTISPECIES: glyoxalase III HchA [Bosea]|uniref:glyoxalase III HchA n=1 Tax=Bosea TaxID=85413 RepID=UPI00214FED3C|nr:MULTISPECIES: glyoxalase III HchA [Bosea]MCR4524739.1 protein deglycase HchA [Bosea sp. 47.2.35]MDR6831682.1 molecular chaperone Hsp31 and glyoxalase 3 [Bosea robiniae]MDR6898392.1 molecular chaperone Hsp31 and glyoxalase 3 [Bosea sp. BE109]MDR7141789.1 molecular chaperone Hsp31 and glyoxalase 3 [Bosea sp. BE168]MDR7178403.1 molecular chaperone Hsp31 and glyoxalase 3 [Bosea sp. BE271]